MAKKKLPVEKLGSKPIPVKIISDAPSPSKSDGDRERKYKAEDALRDIERAEQHRRDKTLMSDVKKLAKEKVNSLKNIC
jgi:hypothetical protein